MRLLLIVLVAVAAALYFTVGLRFGVVTLTETYMLNASGKSSYSYRTVEDNQLVGVTGSCKVRSGQATIRLFDPSGTQVAGQTCQKGEWGLKVMGGGKAGLYHLSVNYDKYTGQINLQETRANR